MADRNPLYVSAGEVVSFTTNDTLALTHGGTGQVTANASLNALLPSQATHSGQVLTTNGTDTSWAAAGGSGTVTSIDVSGGTTGLTTSGGPVTTSGTITLAGTLVVANGGTGQTTAKAARGSSGLAIAAGTSVGDADYVILSTDRFVYTSAALTTTRTWTLPAASAFNAGEGVTIGDVFGGVTSGFVLRVLRAGSDLLYGSAATSTVNGASGATIVLNTAFGACVLVSDGVSKWFLQSRQGINSGNNTGDQTITLTGVVAGSGTAGIVTTLGTNVVANANFRQGVARSVVGVTGNSTADVADIQGTADQVLRVNAAGTALAFGTVAAGGLASDAVTTAKILDANVTTAKLADANVTYAKVQNVAASSLVGNMTTAAAVATDVPIGTGLRFEGSKLQAVFAPLAQCRLSLTDQVSVTTADVTGATSIFCMWYKGSRIALLDSTPAWQQYRFNPFGMPLGTLTSGKNYDVFCFASAATPSSTNTGTDVVTFGSATGWATGSLILVDTDSGGLLAATRTYWYRSITSTTGSFHPSTADAIANTNIVNLTGNVTVSLTGLSLELLVWTNDSTRATSVFETLVGVWVKDGDNTRRLLGTIRTTSTTTTEDSAAKRFVANVDNPVPKRLFTCPGYVDNNTSTTFTSASTTYVEANGGTGSKVEFVVAVPGYAECAGTFSGAPSATGQARAGIAIDSTSSPSAIYTIPAAAGNFSPSVRTGAGFAAGYHYFDMLVLSLAGTATWNADHVRSGGSFDPAATFLEGVVSL